MDPSPFPEMFKPGDVVAGRYLIDRVLGVGGMGVVVAAKHLELDMMVAIKFLRPEALESPETVARFAREAKAAVRIKSEHVARVTDVGTLTTGAPYMVMEHLEGSDLSAIVRAKGSLSVESAVDFVLQACEAIAEAHSLGIVHRDLKPGNLFLSRRADGSELVKVLDFGISKVTEKSASGAQMTQTSAMLGSPTYMSPEQLTSSKNVDLRTDIWAIGIILYELLTGRLPFLADTIPQLCICILQTEPEALTVLRPDAPRGLEACINRCIEKSPARRYSNVGELAVALRAFAPERSRLSVDRILRLMPSGGPAAAAATGLSSQPPPREETVLAPAFDTQRAWGQTAAKPKRAATPKILLLTALGAGALAAGWVALSLQKAPPDPAAPEQHAGSSNPVVNAPSPPAQPVPPPETLNVRSPETAPPPPVETSVAPPPVTAAPTAATFPVRNLPKNPPRPPSPHPSLSAKPNASATPPPSSNPTGKHSDWDEDRQ